MNIVVIFQLKIGFGILYAVFDKVSQVSRHDYRRYTFGLVMEQVWDRLWSVWLDKPAA